MNFLAATSVTLRVMIILIACAMNVGWWHKTWAVVMQRPGWKGHLSGFIATTFATGAAIGCSVNMFPDAGWHIDETFRLAVLDLGMAMIVVALLTSLYRRALRTGPEKARAAFLCGTGLMIPAIGLVVLLMAGGANG